MLETVQFNPPQMINEELKAVVMRCMNELMSY